MTGHRVVGIDPSLTCTGIAISDLIQMTRDRQMARKAPPGVPLSDEQAARVLREGSDSERAPESAPRGAA
jgi:hypothetical protein